MSEEEFMNKIAEVLQTTRDSQEGFRISGHSTSSNLKYLQFLLLSDAEYVYVFA